MKIFYFCARNVEDYIKTVVDTSRANLSLADRQALLNHERVQNILRNYTKCYVDYEESCTSEIFGETGIEGLRIDFNFGLRLDIPNGDWHVKISDYDSEIVVFDADISDIRLISVEKYYIRWQVEIYLNGESIFAHILDLKNQSIQIVLNGKCLGDFLAFMPYVNEFQKHYKCNLTTYISTNYLRELLSYFCPDIKQSENIDYNFYATYYPTFISTEIPILPVDARNTPINRLAGNILGLNYVVPKIKYRPAKFRQIKEPYVCIGVQASEVRKGWLYPNGWDIVTEYLKSLGYRVLCIDKNPEEVFKNYSNRKPDFAEDFTGNISLIERADMLYYAEFFIGLGSGLSWLANAVGCPVIMIAGFSNDWYEFYTPYRVSNPLMCGGCINDIRVMYFKNFCPYHNGTIRELECQKNISPRQIINAIDKLMADKG